MDISHERITTDGQRRARCIPGNLKVREEGLQTVNIVTFGIVAGVNWNKEAQGRFEWDNPRYKN